MNIYWYKYLNIRVMPLNHVAHGYHNHNPKEKKLFLQVSKKWLLVARKMDQCLKREKNNGKPRNPSGKNVYICGNLFVRGTFSTQKIRDFLNWKLLDFGRSSY